MKKTLTETFQEILSSCKVESPFPEGAHLLADLLQAVRERDAFVIGEDDNLKMNKNASRTQVWEDAIYQGPRNFLRVDQKKRAEESL